MLYKIVAARKEYKQVRSGLDNWFRMVRHFRVYGSRRVHVWKCGRGIVRADGRINFDFSLVKNVNFSATLLTRWYCSLV